MSIFEIIKSLVDRASKLEADAQALRQEATDLQNLFTGPTATSAAPVQTKNKTAVTKAPVAAPLGGKAMPTADEIRAKAAEFGVDVSGVMPKGKKPSLQQKQDALNLIHEAKQKQNGTAPTAKTSKQVHAAAAAA